jgi:hypothetical protein
MAFLAAACGNDTTETAAAPTLSPVEQCTETVLGALSQAHAPRADADAVLFQLIHDYGNESPEYNSFLGASYTDFHDVRTSKGMAAGLDYVRPFMENGCAADWSSRPR